METEGVIKQYEIESQNPNYKNMDDLCSAIESQREKYKDVDEVIVILTGTLSPSYGDEGKTALPARFRVIAGVLRFYESIMEGHNPIIITSGGFRNEDEQGPSMMMSKVMKSELVNWYEIPEDKIISEEFSYTTGTNAENVAKLLSEGLHYPKDKAVTVITNQFHSERASQDFEKKYSGKIKSIPAEDIILGHKEENEKGDRYKLPGDKIPHPYKEFVERYLNSSRYKRLALTDFVLRKVSSFPGGEELLRELARITRLKRKKPYKF